MQHTSCSLNHSTRNDYETLCSIKINLKVTTLLRIIETDFCRETWVLIFLWPQVKVGTPLYVAKSCQIQYLTLYSPHIHRMAKLKLSTGQNASVWRYKFFEEIMKSLSLTENKTINLTETILHILSNSGSVTTHILLLLHCVPYASYWERIMQFL